MNGNKLKINLRNINKKEWKNLFVIVIVFLCFVFFGCLLEYFYYKSAGKEMDVEKFTEILHKKEKLASLSLQQIKNQVDKNGISSLYKEGKLYKESEEQDISYMAFEGEKLLFWSNNIIDINSVREFPFKKVFYIKTNNTYSVGVQIFHKKYRYVALIKVKDKIYPKRNNSNNRFAKGFDFPGNVIFAEQTEKNIHTIKALNGQYLFSLKKTPVYQPNEVLYWSCLILWIGAFISLIILFVRFFRILKKEKLSLSMFFLFSAILFLIVFLFSYFRIPAILFSGEFFSPIYYASILAPSIGHLLLYTLFFLFYVFVLEKKVDIHFSLKNYSEKQKRIYTFLLELLSSAIFILVYLLSMNLIYNSGMDVAISLMQDISLITVCSLLLILSWYFLFTILNGKICSIYSKNNSIGNILCARLVLVLIWVIICWFIGSEVDFIVLFFFLCITTFIDIYKHYYLKASFLYISVLAFLLINLVVTFSFLHSEIKNEIKYRTIAENLSVSQVLPQDPIAEELMKEKNKELRTDKNIEELIFDTIAIDNFSKIENYVLKKYFNGFWDKYEIKIQIGLPNDNLDINKNNFEESVYFPASFISEKCIRIGDTNFYLNTEESLSLTYLGVFFYGEKVLYVKFYPNTSYNRISYLEQMLLSNEDKPGVNLNISSVKYYKNELLFLSGDYHYPNSATWIPDTKEKTFCLYTNGYIHYVSKFGEDGYVVISKPEQQSYAYIIFVSYLFACYLFVSLIILLVYILLKGDGPKHSLLTRMQTLFVVPLMLSFVILGAMSVSFFLDQYKKKQISELSFRANSIQQNIQDRFGLVDRFSSIQDQEMEQLLRELSNLFHTDILIYDDNGILIASSRAFYLSEKKKGTRLMSPYPRFSGNTEFYQEEKRGDIDYLAFYVRAYNKKNQQLGYINLLSSSGAVQIKNEIFNILVVIIDVYLFITLLSIFIIWLINKKMTKPIAILSEKFKAIKLTGENAKVEYKYDDEVGQLVVQYNLMVEQLMDSVEKLAKSEREFAWREMARRIAHEIKNPLTPMKLSVQQSVRKKMIDPENFDEYFQKTSKILIEQIDNLSRIASEFSNFAKSAEIQKEQVNIVEKLSSAVSLFENNPEAVSFSLDLNGYDDVFVWADGKQILQVFNNLFKNAIQAIPENRKGKVEVSFSVEKGFVVIRIKDNGCGISEENRKNLFLPNFTTKTSGMGLGLAIVKGIINAFDGDIYFESELNQGTVFILKIPEINKDEF